MNKDINEVESIRSSDLEYRRLYGFGQFFSKEFVHWILGYFHLNISQSELFSVFEQDKDCFVMFFEL